MRNRQLLLFTFFLFFTIQHPVLGYASESQLNLIKHGGYAVSRNDEIILQYNSDIPFIPASILKIATALASFKILKTSHRFETHFFINKNNELIIKGFGDPLLISEELKIISEKLFEQGILSINGILLDPTSFDLNMPADGLGTSQNPYDAGNGALVVNFNTINLLRKQDDTISSAEPQTPTLPIMEKFGQDLAPGSHRINISQNKEPSLNFVGQLFAAKLENSGIRNSGLLKFGKTPSGLKPILVHRSTFTLEQVVAKMLLYSNNFIANQLFLACGAKQFGYPATWDKARKTFKRFFTEKHNLNESDFQILEGSGISRRNRITAKAMIGILHAFRPFSHLLPNENGRPLKTGTLNGVYSLAGYLPKGDKLYPFVIMLNQESNNRNAVLKWLNEELK